MGKNVENMLREALARQDSLAYYRLCREQGREPEDSALYSSGQAEEIVLSSRFVPRNPSSEHEEEILSNQVPENKKKILIKKVCADFLVDVGKAGLNLCDFSSDGYYKRNLLQKYFPARFGKQGKTSVDNMADLSVGALFHNVVKYAESCLRQ